MSYPLLSISEAAKLMGVCENTLRDWDIENKFKAERTLGGHRRYTLDAIRKYLEEKEKQDTPKIEVSSEKTERQRCLDKWKDTEYLDGVDPNDQEVVAVMLENNALSFETSFHHAETIFSRNQVSWLIRERWLRSRFKKMVSVQPLIGPCGLVYYLEHRKNGDLLIASEAVSAKSEKLHFQAFVKADFEKIKDIYADCMALELDSMILDHLPKFDSCQLSLAHVDMKWKNVCDYIISPNIERFKNDPNFEGVDLFNIPTMLDSETFTPKECAGRYSNAKIGKHPIYCPYVTIIQAPINIYGTCSILTRHTWFVPCAKE